MKRLLNWFRGREAARLRADLQQYIEVADEQGRRIAELGG